MGIDSAIFVKFKEPLNHKVLDRIIDAGKKIELVYEDYTIKEECFETCRIEELSSHIMLGLKKNNLHNDTGIDAKYEDAQFDISFYLDESNTSSFLLLPDSVAWKKDFIGDYGIDLKKYIKKIIFPLSKSLHVVKLFITQNGAALQLTNSIQGPYIVGYASMGHHNFTHEHMKVLVGNLIKSGMQIVRADQLLKVPEIENVVWGAIEKNEVEYLDAMYDGYSFKVGLGENEEGNIKIIPQKPFTMKKTEDGECIDLAFYVERVLDIAEGFYLYGLNTSGF